MQKFKVTRDYVCMLQWGGDTKPFALDEGTTVELEPDLAAWIERDAPGTLVTPKAPKPAAPKPKTRQVKGPEKDR